MRFDAWEAQKPPADFAARVEAAVHPRPTRRRFRQARFVLLTLAAILAGATVWAFARIVVPLPFERSEAPATSAKMLPLPVPAVKAKVTAATPAPVEPRAPSPIEAPPVPKREASKRTAAVDGGRPLILPRCECSGESMCSCVEVSR